MNHTFILVFGSSPEIGCSGGFARRSCLVLDKKKSLRFLEGSLRNFSKAENYFLEAFFLVAFFLVAFLAAFFVAFFAIVCSSLDA